MGIKDKSSLSIFYLTPDQFNSLTLNHIRPWRLSVYNLFGNCKGYHEAMDSRNDWGD